MQEHEETVAEKHLKLALNYSNNLAKLRYFFAEPTEEGQEQALEALTQLKEVIPDYRSIYWQPEKNPRTK